MTIEARGAQGQMLFNGHSVTITRRGFIPFLTHGAGGTKTVPLRAITAVQHRRWGLYYGYLQLSVSGELESRRGGKESLKEDENTVVFYAFGQKQFQQMADVLRRAIADAAAGLEPVSTVGGPAATATPASTKTPMEQLAELGQLRDNGYITPADFEAKKNEILSRI